MSCLIFTGKALSYLMQDLVCRRELLADDEGTRIFKNVEDSLTPGTSPAPAWPAVSVSKVTLRVKNGA